MANEHTNRSASDANLMAIFAYLGILLIIPFLTDSKNNPFVKFHLKQGLALLIFGVVGWILAVVVGWIPVIGFLVTFVWNIVWLLLAILGIINVLQNKEKDLPLVGQFGNSFKF